MSRLSSSARSVANKLRAAVLSSAKRVLSALPFGDGKVPTPKDAFHCESTILTVLGVLHVLAPVFVLRASFLGAGKQQEGLDACVDESSEEAIGAALVALIQALGSAKHSMEPLSACG